MENNIDYLKAVIIEDEPESLHLLENLINAGGLAVVSGVTSNPEQALGLIISLNPDIVFLDIKMPGKNGFEILDDLRKVNSIHPYIVFTTAYDEYALKAFEYSAFDYLLKPVEPKRLADTILRGINNRNQGIKQKTDQLLGNLCKLMFRNISGIVFIDQNEIIHIEAEGNYSVFHLTNKRTETVTALLGKVEEQIDHDKFFRVSRSFIINLEFLKKINTKQLHCVLSCNGIDVRCDIARDRVNALIAKMKKR